MDQLHQLSWPSAIAILLACAACYAIFTLHNATRRPANFPPGPPTVFGLGNLIHMPITAPFLKFHEWKTTYGDIIGLKVANQNYVILQSADHVHELLARKGSIYSDRMQPYIGMHIMNPESALFWNYDDRTKKATRAWRHALGPEGLKRTQPHVDAFAALMTGRLLEQSDRFHDIAKRWALDSTLMTVTGMQLDELEPGYLDAYFSMQKRWLYYLQPSTAPPVDLLPVLKYLPPALVTWKRAAAELGSEFSIFMGRYLESAKAKHAEMPMGPGPGEQRFEPFMAWLVRQSLDKSGLFFKSSEIKGIGNTTIDGSVDTSLYTTTQMVHALASFPEVQEAAQREVDSLCPNAPPMPDQLPSFRYLRAIFYELLRWRPPVPTAPRVLREDDTYGSFHLPKGTVCLINSYSIQNDPDWYDKPLNFSPQRYVDNPWGVKPSRRAEAEARGRKRSFTFGVGRRQCPGADFAEQQVILSVAKLVWAFEVTALAPVDWDWETGFNTAALVVGPKPTPVRFEVRGEGKAKAVRDDATRGKHLLASIR
ncbi:cytochrome P450 [Plectosphaerella plurivora]|uniref:Cytochrome P450 n=1 Tax=Plectosphaerella plurivora TaxID=936078 RepID=A0A9P9A9Z5_9PEZI|nr:cytochrome P450 [Plectosphaerella plurivora]